MVFGCIFPVFVAFFMATKENSEVKHHAPNFGVYYMDARRELDQLREEYEQKRIKIVNKWEAAAGNK